MIDAGTVGIIGIIAGGMTWTAQVPQLQKIIRTRSTRDLSLRSATLLFGGTVLLFVYGVCLGELPLILWNVLGTATSGGILAFKAREVYDGRPR